MSVALVRFSSPLGWLSTQIAAAQLQVHQVVAQTSSSAHHQKESQGGRSPSAGGRKRNRRRPLAWTPFEPSDVNVDSEWSSVQTGPRPFDPYLVPLPIRMGRAEKDSISPPAIGNLELMKIPNFFHLTPLHIKKHCEALKPLCTPWPSKLPSLPLRIETRNYIFPGHSIRHSGASKVTLTFKLDDLMLTDRARSKMIALAGPRYNPERETIRVVGKRCPTRKQNYDYVMYLLKVLYLESNRVEPWEEEESSECAG